MFHRHIYNDNHPGFSFDRIAAANPPPPGPTIYSLYSFFSAAGDLSSFVGLLYSIVRASEAYLRYFVRLTRHKPGRLTVDANTRPYDAVMFIRRS